MWDIYNSKLNFTALCIIKPKIMVFIGKTTVRNCKDDCKEGYVHEAYVCFCDFGPVSGST